jgi:DNA helicase HerA-like ATPase
MLHPHYLDTHSGPVGRVVTNEENPATAHEFYFWTAESEAAQKLDIGHIVAAESEDSTAIAVLDDPRRYSDLQSFLDDFYAFEGDPSLPALSERVEILVFKARVLATKHRDERKKSKRPVKSGPVFFATREAVEFSLGADGFSGERIPMLLHENGNEQNGAPQRTPLYVDADYLLGPEAGHLNITGMSGLSTKTSHALFTISSVFQTARDKKVAALMFNVKGADLLYLDKPVEVSRKDDPELAARYEKAGQRGLPPEDREMYEALGLKMQPFENLRIFAPLGFGNDPQGGTVYPAEIPAKKLNTLRKALGEDTNVHPIVWDLGDVLPHAGRIFDPQDYDDKFKGFVEFLRSDRVRTMRGFHARVDEAFEYFEETESSYWNGHHQATVAKVRNRFGVLPSKCSGLLVDGKVDYAGSPSVEDAFTDREMRVVDISNLSGVPQDLVVTKVINTVWEMAEQGRLGVDKLIIFVDELNKYAPSGSRTSSLKDTLVDISARGRHLSLTLFGAQQFRSKVDDEVVGNAATSLYGRIGDEELTNSSYRSFSATTRDELLQLEKGRLLLRHAHYAVPVFGRFPRPAVLMGAKGTQIFGENAYAQDPATMVLAVMRNLPGKTPTIAAVRSDIEGVPREQVETALGAVQAAHRAGKGSADSYKNFVWNLKRGEGRPRPARRDGSRILSGLERMRD